MPVGPKRSIGKKQPLNQINITAPFAALAVFPQRNLNCADLLDLMITNLTTGKFP